jgi:gamma-glutamyltranspeptidase
VHAGIPFPGRSSPRTHRGDTCYFCVVDEDGLAVSAIQSLFQDFGSMAAGGDTGILLQNRGSYFSLRDDDPNRLEPRKRTFHTLIPAMLFRGGRPYLVFGTMGGGGQPQTHAALLTRILDFGYDVQQAIDTPRWVVGQTLGKRLQHLYLEGRVREGIVRELLRRGQSVRVDVNWSEDMGHAQAIRIDHNFGFLEGGADPRGDGMALGY